MKFSHANSQCGGKPGRRTGRARSDLAGAGHLLVKLKRDLESLIGDLLEYLDRRNRRIMAFCDYSATPLCDYSATFIKA
jgi:hypothetical protein